MDDAGPDTPDAGTYDETLALIAVYRSSHCRHLANRARYVLR